jgi:hypothetical protein
LTPPTQNDFALEHIISKEEEEWVQDMYLAMNHLELQMILYQTTEKWVEKFKSQFSLLLSYPLECESRSFITSKVASCVLECGSSPLFKWYVHRLEEKWNNEVNIQLPQHILSIGQRVDETSEQLRILSEEMLRTQQKRTNVENHMNQVRTIEKWLETYDMRELCVESIILQNFETLDLESLEVLLLSSRRDLLEKKILDEALFEYETIQQSVVQELHESMSGVLFIEPIWKRLYPSLEAYVIAIRRETELSLESRAFAKTFLLPVSGTVDVVRRMVTRTQTSASSQVLFLTDNPHPVIRSIRTMYYRCLDMIGRQKLYLQSEEQIVLVEWMKLLCIYVRKSKERNKFLAHQVHFRMVDV